MTNESSNKIVNFENTKYYDEKIKDYIDKKLGDIETILESVVEV